MRSILTRCVLLAAAGLIAATALDPASAATRHKRAAPAQIESSADVAGLPIRPDWSPVPSTAWQAPNTCVTDEGYGRYTACDQGGF